MISNLKSVLQKEVENSKTIIELGKYLEKLEKDSRSHIQKVGFLRFNPFQELGGDHSFSAALLDNNDTGIIITGLHSRERTRVYVKEIKKGKSQIELSKEERRSLQIAQKG